VQEFEFVNILHGIEIKPVQMAASFVKLYSGAEVMQNWTIVVGSSFFL